jgi:hypothetical protein
LLAKDRRWPGFDKLCCKVYNVCKVSNPCIQGGPLERTIGATELRQRLTDVLQSVREEQATYVIATFDRSQAALVNLEEYRQFQQFRQEREAFLTGSTTLPLKMPRRTST